MRVYLRFSNSHDSGFWGFWGDSQAAYDGRFIYFGFGDVTWGILDKVPSVYHYGGGTPSSNRTAGRFPNRAFSKHFVGKAANTRQHRDEYSMKMTPMSPHELPYVVREHVVDDTQWTTIDLAEG